MANMGGFRLELNPIESFSFFCKTLWAGDNQKRFHAQIPDTIVFFRGRPHSWYFSSQKTGEVLRKKADKMHSVAYIVDYFKQKSRTFPGYRPNSMRQKIATVWYLKTETELSTYIVDGSELGSLLSSTLKEVLAVQVYYGGNPSRGNGVFEHKFWPQKNGTSKHITYEYIDESYEFNLTQFSLHGRKITVLDHLQDILSQYSHNICRNIESQFVCKVVNLSFTIVFTNSWIPVLVNFQDLVLEGLSGSFLDNREALIYFEGEAPVLPPINEMSTLLPIYDPALSARKKIDSHGLVDNTNNKSSTLTKHSPDYNDGRVHNHGSLSHRSTYSDDDSQITQGNKRPVSANAFSTSRVATSQQIDNHHAKDKHTEVALQNNVFDVLYDHDHNLRNRPNNDINRVMPESSIEHTSTFKSKAHNCPQPVSFSSRKYLEDDDDDLYDDKKEHPNHGDDDDEERMFEQGRRKRTTRIPDSAEIALGFRQSLRQTKTVDALVKQHEEQQQPHKSLPHPVSPSQNPVSPSSIRRLNMPTNASHQIARIGLQKRIHNHFIEEGNVHLDDSPDDTIGVYPSELDRQPNAVSPSHYSQTHHTSNSYSLNRLAGHQPVSDTMMTKQGHCSGNSNSSATSATSHSPTSHASLGSHHIHIPKNIEEMNDGSHRGLAHFISKRRPISAPHNSERSLRGRRAKSTLRQFMATVSTLGTHQSPATQNSGYNHTTTMDHMTNNTIHISTRGPLSANASQRIISITPQHYHTIAYTTPVTSTLSRAAVDKAGDSAAQKYASESENARRPSSAFLWRDMVRHASAGNNLQSDVPLAETAVLSTLPLPRTQQSSAIQRKQTSRPTSATTVHQRGVRCYGDFCHFQTIARHLIETHVDDPAALQQTVDALASAEKSHDLAHKLSLKSIILARTEMKFVSVPLDSPVESLVVRSRLQPLDDDAVCMYFVRRHINRIAQKCQEEARLLLFGHRSGNMASLLSPEDSKLSSLYRRLVYGAALAQVHPSRFYYAVHLCHCCYKMYSFLDAQRDSVILHPVEEVIMHYTHATGHHQHLWEKSATSNTASNMPPISFTSSNEGHLFGGASVAYQKEDEDWRNMLESVDVTGGRSRSLSIGFTGFRRPRSATSLRLQRATSVGREQAMHQTDNTTRKKENKNEVQERNDDDSDDDIFKQNQEDLRVVRQLQRKAILSSAQQEISSSNTASASSAVERTDSADYYRYQHSSFSQQKPSNPSTVPPVVENGYLNNNQANSEVSNNIAPLSQQRRHSIDGLQTTTTKPAIIAETVSLMSNNAPQKRNSMTSDPKLAIQIADSASAFGLCDPNASIPASPIGSAASLMLSKEGNNFLRGTASQSGVTETKRMTNMIQKINNQQQQLLASAQTMDYQKLYVQHQQLFSQQNQTQQQQKPHPPRPQSASFSSNGRPVRLTSQNSSYSRNSSFSTGGDGNLVIKDAVAAAIEAIETQEVLPDENGGSARMMLPENEQRISATVSPNHFSSVSRSSFSQQQQGKVTNNSDINNKDEDSNIMDEKVARMLSGLEPDTGSPFSFSPSLALSDSVTDSPHVSGTTDNQRPVEPPVATRGGTKSKSLHDLRVLAVQNNLQQQILQQKTDVSPAPPASQLTQVNIQQMEWLRLQEQQQQEQQKVLLQMQQQQQQMAMQLQYQQQLILQQQLQLQQQQQQQQPKRQVEPSIVNTPPASVPLLPLEPAVSANSSYPPNITQNSVQPTTVFQPQSHPSVSNKNTVTTSSPSPSFPPVTAIVTDSNSMTFPTSGDEAKPKKKRSVSASAAVSPTTGPQTVSQLDLLFTAADNFGSGQHTNKFNASKPPTSFNRDRKSNAVSSSSSFARNSTPKDTIAPSPRSSFTKETTTPAQQPSLSQASVASMYSTANTNNGSTYASVGSKIRASQDAQAIQAAKLKELDNMPISAEAEAYAEEIARKYAAELHQDIVSLYASLDAESSTGTPLTNGNNKHGKHKCKSGCAPVETPEQESKRKNKNNSYSFALDTLPFGADTPLYSLSGERIQSLGLSQTSTSIATRTQLTQSSPVVTLSAVLEGDAEDDDAVSLSLNNQGRKNISPISHNNQNRVAPVIATAPAAVALHRGDSGQSVTSQLSSAPTVIVHPLSPTNHRHLSNNNNNNKNDTSLNSNLSDGLESVDNNNNSLLIDVPVERDIDPLTEEDDELARMFVLSITPNSSSSFPTHSNTSNNNNNVNNNSNNR